MAVKKVKLTPPAPKPVEEASDFTIVNHGHVITNHGNTVVNSGPPPQDTETVVWAYKELAILNRHTGIVGCLQSVADDLIASGEVQDMRIGLFAMKPVEAGSDWEQSGDNAMNALVYNNVAPVAPVAAIPAPTPFKYDSLNPSGPAVFPIPTNTTLHPTFSGGPIAVGDQTMTIAFTATPPLAGSIVPVVLPAGKTLIEATQLIADAIDSSFPGEIGTRMVMLNYTDPPTASFFLTYRKAGGVSLDSATFTLS